MISTIILFAMIVAGLVGYLVFVNNGEFSGNQANQVMQNQNQAANQEHLSLAAYNVSSGLYANWISVEVYNSGGVPVDRHGSLHHQ